MTGGRPRGGSNLSVLNGAGGLSELAAALVSQGTTILGSVKKGLASESETASSLASAMTASEFPGGDPPDGASPE